MAADRERRLLAVLGSPIAHSQSPALHRTAYAALGMPWEYELHDVPAGELLAFVARLDQPWRGLSLTMPLKETILPALDAIDVVGTLTGAVNTVLVTFDDGRRRLAGFNTDVHGIVAALGAAGVTEARNALVLGAGATARSAVVAVAELGGEHIDLALRDPAKSAAVEAVAHASGLSIDVHPLAETAIRGLEPDITISALPGGVGADAVLAETLAPRTSTLLDVAYHPWPSELSAVWEGAGSRTISGLAMLAHQAVGQIRVFVHGDPLVHLTDEERITEAMLDAVGLDPSGAVRP